MYRNEIIMFFLKNSQKCYSFQILLYIQKSNFDVFSYFILIIQSRQNINNLYNTTKIVISQSKSKIKIIKTIIYFALFNISYPFHHSNQTTRRIPFGGSNPR